jgi:glutathione S-transferase
MKMSLTLVIGNKNYSSWSMRPWFAMKGAGIPFAEVVVSLYVPGCREEILKHTPSGKVPALIDGGVTVWDSLAIIEYLNEKFPDKKLWPQDGTARALARSVSAEMHSSFQGLRSECGMNVRRKPSKRDMSEQTLADIARVQQIWADCRAGYGKGGPFLFGAFTAADAMYAPVVSRFLSYAIDVTPATRAYMDAVTALPAWREWTEGATAESWVIEKFEV